MSMDKLEKVRAEARRPLRRKLEKASQVVVGDVVWSLVEAQTGSEPVWAGGREQKQRVDTETYCYQMVCACGRVRFAKPNTLHEVKFCRICQHQHRLAARRKKVS